MNEEAVIAFDTTTLLTVLAKGAPMLIIPYNGKNDPYHKKYSQKRKVTEVLGRTIHSD